MGNQGNWYDPKSFNSTPGSQLSTGIGYQMGGGANGISGLSNDKSWINSIIDGLSGLEPGKLEGWGNLASGVGSVGSAVTGFMSYLEGKERADRLEKMELANYEQQKNRANLEASRREDTIARHKGGGSSARTRALMDKTIAAA